MAVEVKISPTRTLNRETQKKIQKLRDKIKDPTPVNRNIAVWLMRWVHENFDTKGGKVGGWPPYKYGGRLVKKSKANAQSIEGRRYVDTSAHMLIDTGDLRKSYLPFWDRVTAGVGTKLPYAEFHETGTVHLPPRRMIPKSSGEKEVEDYVLRIYKDYVVHAAESENFKVSKV